MVEKYFCILIIALFILIVHLLTEGTTRCACCDKLILKLISKKRRFTDSPKDTTGYSDYVCNKCYEEEYNE